MKKSLIFIPDISGFSEFTSGTEIVHSSHIISDLFKVILETNSLNLDLIEIEGDALLFVKKDVVHSEKDIYEMAVKMYEAFHLHLLSFDTNRVCECNACVMAPKLSLKFFVHNSELVEINIGTLKKYHGPGLILVHRLMKNDVPSDDYILFSNSFNRDNLDQTITSEGSKELKVLGQVKYFYADLKTRLKDLRAEAYAFEPISDPLHSQSESVIIESSMYSVKEDLSDLVRKGALSVGKINIKKYQHTMSYAGNEHVCTVMGMNLRITTSDIQSSNKEVKIIEEVKNMPMFKRIHKQFVIEYLEEVKSKLTVNYIIKKNRNLMSRMLGNKVSLFILNRMVKMEAKIIREYYNA